MYTQWRVHHHGMCVLSPACLPRPPVLHCLRQASRQPLLLSVAPSRGRPAPVVPPAVKFAARPVEYWEHQAARVLRDLLDRWYLYLRHVPRDPRSRLHWKFNAFDPSVLTPSRVVTFPPVGVPSGTAIPAPPFPRPDLRLEHFVGSDTHLESLRATVEQLRAVERQRLLVTARAASTPCKA